MENKLYRRKDKSNQHNYRILGHFFIEKMYKLQINKLSADPFLVTEEVFERDYELVQE